MTSIKKNNKSSVSLQPPQSFFYFKTTNQYSFVLTIIKLILIIIVFFLFSAANANGKTFRLVSAIYPPYNYVDGEIKGLNIEIIKAAFTAVDYQVTVDMLPFARALLYAKRGDFDGMTLWHSKQRENWFQFSKPFTQSDLVFFKRKSLQVNYLELADLTPFTIGTVQKYSYPKAFSKLQALRKDEVLTDEQNLKKLISGRIDIALIDKRMAQFIMKRDHTAQQPLFDSAGVLKIENYYLAVSKNTTESQDKLAKFNLGLSIIENNGVLKKIIEKYDSDKF